MSDRMLPQDLDSPRRTVLEQFQQLSSFWENGEQEEARALAEQFGFNLSGGNADVDRRLSTKIAELRQNVDADFSAKIHDHFGRAGKKSD